MSTLILLRHGQAAFGADHYDVLSDLGRQQAEAVGRHFASRELRFSRLWIGPRERHRLTAQHALGFIGMTTTQAPEPSLDEFAEGQQILASAVLSQGVRLRGEGAISGREARRAYAAEIDAWAAGRVQIEGVRAPRDFRARVCAWLRNACADPSPGQTILAVTSGGVIAAVLAEVLAQPDAALAHYMHAVHNGSLTELAFSAGRAPGLMSFNETGYLRRDLLTRI